MHHLVLDGMVLMKMSMKIHFLIQKTDIQKKSFRLYFIKVAVLSPHGNPTFVNLFMLMGKPGNFEQIFILYSEQTGKKEDCISPVQDNHDVHCSFLRVTAQLYLKASTNNTMLNCHQYLPLGHILAHTLLPICRHLWSQSKQLCCDLLPYSFIHFQNIKNKL